MRLIDLKCSNCGATMKVNPELRQVSCNYCGNTMLIDDEIKKLQLVNGLEYGYELEKGRIIAQKEEELRKLDDKQKKTYPEIAAWIVVSVVLTIVCFKVEPIMLKFLVGFFIIAALDRLYIVVRDLLDIQSQIGKMQNEIESYNYYNNHHPN